MDGIVGNRVAMPANPTAWLIANMRKGAMLYTRDGLTVALINTQTTATDPDRGFQLRPLYPALGEPRTQYQSRPTRPMLD